jgi:hypothetical protein
MRWCDLLRTVLIGVGVLAGQPLLAQNLNIDLSQAQGFSPSNAFGAAANQAGTWNSLKLGTTPNLLGLNGASTSVSATVTAGTDLGTGGSTCTGDLHLLLDDNIYTRSGTWTVALTGLTNGTYTLYLYEPTNDNVPTGQMTVNGVALAGITGHGCALTAGTTYTTTQVTVTTGNLTIIGTSPGTGLDFAGLAGLQLAPGQAGPPPAVAAAVPTASMWGLALLSIALGGLALLRMRRRIGA